MDHKKIEIIQATLAEANISIEILEEATDWLAAKELAVWVPGQFEKFILPAINRGELFLAKLENRFVGTFILQWSDPQFWGQTPDDAGYIHKLAVRRNYSGKQIGRYILKWSENRILERGRQFFRLDCQARNPVINSYYSKAGFEFRGISPDKKHHIYEKRLGVPALPIGN